MTGDEMERAIEFILRNQANYEARQAEYQAEYHARQAEIDAKLAAERAETDRQIRELASAQDRTQTQLDRLSEQVAHLGDQVGHLGDQVGHLGDQVGHLRSIASVLIEGQRSSREDIDALVKLVGGLIERKNGGGRADA